MFTAKNVMICGFYLNFATLRKCIDELQRIQVSLNDISVLLPDGSIMSAMPILRDPQKFEATLRIRNGSDKVAYSASARRVVSIAGTLTQTLRTLGIPVYDAERLEGRISNGGILVSIRCDDSGTEFVRKALVQTGAEDTSLAHEPKVELEAHSVPRKDPFAPSFVNDCQQRGVHA